ncbi:MAG TPA: NBR1-Ig-like domain-containing protein [Anaerolineales bacterium]|nr:NBR1-Ig-like domain-containing protein [Anaerolineales bacterium]
MKPKYLSLLLVCGLLISACGGSTTPEPTPDVAAVRTSAARTVEARFTLTAAAFTPTPQPTPTETTVPEPEATATATEAPVAVVTNEEGTPVELCDSLGYDILTVDVNVPDNTIMSPGQDFVKTWHVKNTGACPWGAGYVLTYAGYADRMSGQFIAMAEVVQPGQEVEVSVQFKAPDQAGEYLSAWTMQNPQGVEFPEIVFVKIIVQ